MAPFYVSLNKTAPWSPCSAYYVTEFFDNGHGEYELKPLPLWTSATTKWLFIEADSAMNKTCRSSLPLFNDGFPAGTCCSPQIVGCCESLSCSRRSHPVLFPLPV